MSKELRTKYLGAIAWLDNRLGNQRVYGQELGLHELKGIYHSLIGDYKGTHRKDPEYASNLIALEKMVELHPTSDM